MTSSHLVPSLTLFGIFLGACGGGGGGGGAPAPAAIANLTVAPQGAPTVQYVQVSPGRFRTRIVVPHLLVTQAAGGTPVIPSQNDLIVERYVDDVLDNESIVDEQAVTPDLLVSLVLDASFSMTQHQPPAFAPMLAAARRTLEDLAQWKTQQVGGRFAWWWSWFDDFIYSPDGASMSIDNLSRIPTPTSGDATRLYGAVDSMLDVQRQWRNGSGPGVGRSPLDRYVIVVFTDGRDNLSANTPNASFSETRTSPFPHTARGRGAVSLTGLTNKLGDTANAFTTLHALGMGSQINQTELAAMATAGRGSMIVLQDASRLDTLFDQVRRTIQQVRYQGADIPIDDNNTHRFSLRIRAKSNPALVGRVDFEFVGGSVNPRFVRFL